MEYKIVASSSPEGLAVAVRNKTNEGWEPMGSHQVVVIHSQNRYSGMLHMDTKHETEYSQTMVKKFKPSVIEVDIAFYHPEDENGVVDETKRVYDEEGMREEFEYKLDCIIKNAGL